MSLDQFEFVSVMFSKTKTKIFILSKMDGFQRFFSVFCVLKILWVKRIGNECCQANVCIFHVGCCVFVAHIGCVFIWNRTGGIGMIMQAGTSHCILYALPLLIFSLFSFYHFDVQWNESKRNETKWWHFLFTILHPYTLPNGLLAVVWWCKCNVDFQK